MGEAFPFSPVASPSTRDNPPDVIAGHQLQGGRISLTLIFSHFHWNDRQLSKIETVDRRNDESPRIAPGSKDAYPLQLLFRT